MLDARQIRPVGVGELLARIEHLKRTLASEGLFDADRKQPLPFLPRTVGLVCGRASAAEKDVVENARRRWPTVRFAIREVAVQGPTAVAEVTAFRRSSMPTLASTSSSSAVAVARSRTSSLQQRDAAPRRLGRAHPGGQRDRARRRHPPARPRRGLARLHPTDAGKRVVPDAGEERGTVRQARVRARQVPLPPPRASAAPRGDPIPPGHGRPHRRGRREELEALTRRSRGSRRCWHRAADHVAHSARPDPHAVPPVHPCGATPSCTPTGES